MLAGVVRKGVRVVGRIRTIKPAFFTNDEVAQCHPLTRILFIGLWTQADKEGRLEERPVRIKAELMPIDDCDIVKMLAELEAQSLIIRYAIGKRNYIQIANFKKHQRPHPKEPPSEIPEPCFAVKKNGRAVKKNGSAVEKSSVLQEGKGREGVSGKEHDSCSEPTSPASEPDASPEIPVLEFPTHGDKKTWPLTQTKLSEYTESFPAVDVLAECRKALQWCRDNPTKQKTFTGMAKFIGGWLGRAQDRGGKGQTTSGQKFGGIKSWLEK